MPPQVPLKQLNVCWRNGPHHSANHKSWASWHEQGHHASCQTLLGLRLFQVLLCSQHPETISHCQNRCAVWTLGHSGLTGQKSNTTKHLMTTSHLYLSKSSNQPNTHHYNSWPHIHFSWPHMHSPWPQCSLSSKISVCSDFSFFLSSFSLGYFIYVLFFCSWKSPLSNFHSYPFTYFI